MNTDCYVGIKPCGCIVAVVMDWPDAKWKKQMSKTISAYIQRGYKVQPALIESVRSKLGPCKCKTQ